MRMKFSLRLYLSIIRHLTSLCLCFSFFQIMFQLLLTSYLKWPSVRFIYRYWRWCFVNIFRLEVVNSKNRPACFKDFLNANGFNPHTPDPTPSAAFALLLCTKRWTQTKPWICHCVGRGTEKHTPSRVTSLQYLTPVRKMLYILNLGW